MNLLFTPRMLTPCAFFSTMPSTGAMGFEEHEKETAIDREVPMRMAALGTSAVSCRLTDVMSGTEPRRRPECTIKRQDADSGRSPSAIYCEMISFVSPLALRRPSFRRRHLPQSASIDAMLWLT